MGIFQHHTIIAFCMLIPYSRAEKTFTNDPRSTEIVKVFSLESSPLYGNMMMYYYLPALQLVETFSLSEKVREFNLSPVVGSTQKHFLRMHWISANCPSSSQVMLENSAF